MFNRRSAREKPVVLLPAVLQELVADADIRPLSFRFLHKYNNFLLANSEERKASNLLPSSSVVLANYFLFLPALISKREFEKEKLKLPLNSSVFLVVINKCKQKAKT